MAFEKKTCYIRARVTKQRLNAELSMSCYSQHICNRVHNLV